MAPPGLSSTKPNSIRVVIPARDESEYIGQCLLAISQLDQTNTQVEVVLVDNGSLDDTVAIAMEFGAIVVVKEGGTISSVRNAGAVNCDHAIIRFVDADCAVQPGWLESALRHFEDQTVVAVGSYPQPPPSVVSWVHRTFVAVVTQPPGPAAITEWLPSANMIVRRDTFERVGGFDENMVTAEDADLSYRLKEHGKLVNDHAVSMIHYREPSTLLELFEKESWRGLGSFDGVAKGRWTKAEIPSLLTPLVTISGIGLTTAAVVLLPFGFETLPTLSVGLILCGSAPVVYTLRAIITRAPNSWTHKVLTLCASMVRLQMAGTKTRRQLMNESNCHDPYDEHQSVLLTNVEVLPLIGGSWRRLLAVPIKCGLPLPRGRCKDVERLAVRDAKALDSLCIESEGPIRTTIAGEGRIGSSTLLKFRVWFSFFSGLDLVGVECTIVTNRCASHPGGIWELGGRGSCFFTEIKISANLTDEPVELVMSTESDVPSSRYQSPVHLNQESSGGINWLSLNHVNRHNEIPLQFRGWKLRSGDHEETGLRASPYLKVRTDSGSVALALEDFWQQFPKSLSTEGRTLELGLWPAEFPDLHELQAGEQKTHRLWLRFSDNPICDGDNEFAWVFDPPIASAPPEFYSASGAIPYLTPLDEETHPSYETFVRQGIDGQHAFVEKPS